MGLSYQSGCYSSRLNHCFPTFLTIGTKYFFSICCFCQNPPDIPTDSSPKRWGDPWMGRSLSAAPRNRGRGLLFGRTLSCPLSCPMKQQRLFRGCGTLPEPPWPGLSLRQRIPGETNSTFLLYFVPPYQGFFLFSCKIYPSPPDPLGKNSPLLAGFFTKKIQFVHFLLLFFSI